MKILTSEQMRSIDRRATEQYGIPSILLMENAAAAVVEAILVHYSDVERVAILCGTGNNGGDGLAIARHLLNRDVTPVVFIIGDRAGIAGDSRTNLAICERLGLPLYDVADADSLDQALARASQTDLLVDAIFGTGLNRAPADLFAEAIRGMMSLRLPIVAVDIPSGLNGSSAEPFEPAIRADLTVTFARPKIPHVFAPASSLCGEIIVADISIPNAAVDSESVTLSVIAPEDVAALVPERESATHKGTYGHVAIVAGSEGRSGAAILAARGSIRGGAGLTTVLSDLETTRIVDSTSIESMSLAITRELKAIPGIVETLARFDAVMIGPGLPDDEKSYAFLRELISKTRKPLVLDATAINAHQGKPESLRANGEPRILTPHPGELGRLLGAEAAQINRERIRYATEAAQRTGCVVVLKGHQTVIAEPDGEIAVNPTGNAGMASGGMGDVLSGLTAAFLASGHDPFASAIAAVYLHGLAGDLLRERASDIGLAAMDLADMIPHAIERVRLG